MYFICVSTHTVHACIINSTPHSLIPIYFLSIQVSFPFWGRGRFWYEALVKMDAVWLIVFSVLCLTIAVKLWTVLRRRPRIFTLGFFHPYADAGGGGERVLWHSMDAILSRNRSMKCLVWTGERDRTKDQILDKVKARFGLDLPRTRVTFVFLRLRVAGGGIDVAQTDTCVPVSRFSDPRPRGID